MNDYTTGTTGSNGSVPPPDKSSDSRVKGFDAVPFGLAVVRHWPWILFAVIVCTSLGAFAGWNLWSAGFEAKAQLIRYETPDPEIIRPTGVGGATLAGIMDATEVHTRVGNRVTPSLTAKEVSDYVRMSPERNSDIINIQVVHPDLDTAVALANAYAEETARFTREIQSEQASSAGHYLGRQQREIQSEINTIEDRLQLAVSGFSPGTGDLNRTTALRTRLEEARDRHLELMGRYTEAHPLVQEQMARIDVLERQLILVAEDQQSGVGEGETNPEILQEILSTLESQRLALARRQQLARTLQEDPPGYIRMFAAATEEHATVVWPIVPIGMLTVFSAMFGFVSSLGLIALWEVLDRRLKNADDVSRVTRLPVLASVGRLDRMSPNEQEQWAFRSWIALQDRLDRSPNKGLVCGFTSAVADEGRSEWVKHLAGAANRCGYRVLNITSRPSPLGRHTVRADKSQWLYASGFWKLEDKSSSSTVASAPEQSESIAVNAMDDGETVSTNVLASPDEITRRFDESEAPSLVYIPLPGWVWDLERRKQWMSALNHWSQIDNLVILVELPPASSPETVLLAQNLPNLVWLADVTRAGAPETHMHLKTLRQARCNLVGAVVNRLPGSDNAHRFSRWVSGQAAAFTLAAMLWAMVPGLGAANERADWQQNLTLGPGDVLRLALYGEPELTRDEVAVQPDGRIHFLEVNDLIATGLTVDELRDQLNERLGEFRRAPRTMVTPLEYRSKKYYMLGKVAEKGAFTLNRPVSVVEAVALARGFETGLSGRNVVELVDLSRSFLVRDGRRMDVDFVSLFTKGDISHNLELAPGDYLYFPPADPDEVHLLGEVGGPGSVNFTSGLTATRAVASAGGFTQRAWRQRIAVVRGSLEDPHLMTVNVAAVLAGNEQDIELHPGDIVFVSERPWIRAEELLEDVTRAFVQSVIVYWVSDDVFPAVR